jgi:hypothetical protein
MSPIIARLFDAGEEVAAIRRKVTSRHDEEGKRSTFWRRIMIWWTIEREVRAEMKRKHPPGALYTTR